MERFPFFILFFFFSKGEEMFDDICLAISSRRAHSLPLMYSNCREPQRVN